MSHNSQAILICQLIRTKKDKNWKRQFVSVTYWVIVLRGGGGRSYFSSFQMKAYGSEFRLIQPSYFFLTSQLDAYASSSLFNPYPANVENMVSS